ncbi:hypothetical protein Back11_55780 [Paenibacillus baekrokdamisoli]|uniref:Uncharacterized protein n=1 Tax=Paenibacillus baekrokdamisoli TaxID=1712516 RepID=A0A3G9JGZ8_9BACL|nr:hypothetical protein [Paenibacillus baekrokdamisoli]MBB3071785.1 hypothetical protein [Paenibacillus baekrokdamisoli]BBH24233.1 hypothetical protein Back11_55780 [Paenibacillus baekrokdamisoli]
MAVNPLSPGQNSKRVAVIVTEYTFNSHADVILGRLLGDFEYTPRIEVAAIYTDQVPENDMSRERAASRGVPIYLTIEETLTSAHADGGLDGIIIIGEHGDYPEDQYGRKWYPRRRFFEEVLRVLDNLNETTIPIFSDKHLAYNIDDTVWMYNELLKRDHPFMGGSSIPHAPHVPALDPTDIADASEWLVVSFSSQTEKYGFHALEVLQSLAERRQGSNLGVQSILALQGNEVWEAMARNEWPEDLMMSAQALFNKADSTHPKHSSEKTVLFIVNYVNGTRGYVIQQNNWIDRWGFSIRSNSGDIHSAICLSDLERPFGHFETLTRMIEDFINTRVEPFPKKRTFLTSGMINYAMESLYERKRMETAELIFK